MSETADVINLGTEVSYQPGHYNFLRAWRLRTIAKAAGQLATAECKANPRVPPIGTFTGLLRAQPGLNLNVARSNQNVRITTRLGEPGGPYVVESAVDVLSDSRVDTDSLPAISGRRFITHTQNGEEVQAALDLSLHQSASIIQIALIAQELPVPMFLF